jgi:hypothetical protein
MLIHPWDAAISDTGCSQESAACACTSPASPPSSNTMTTTRKNTASRSPDASKTAEPAGTAPQPPSNAGASTKSANGNPAAYQISSSGKCRLLTSVWCPSGLPPVPH